MTQTCHGRRDLLGVALATTLGSATVLGAARSRAAEAGPPRTGIDDVLRRAVEAREVPGIVAVAATDKGVFYEGAFGTRDLTKGPPMTLDTVFRIASMTKAVTSVAALQLVEQGKLKLDDPVPPIDPA
ncbi:MAG TPA: serine hydrolase domain-containing protein, partial [Acetobacteraceae bacterium]